jgi:hypothetical protein
MEGELLSRMLPAIRSCVVVLIADAEHRHRQGTSAIIKAAPRLGQRDVFMASVRIAVVVEHLPRGDRSRG